MTCQPIPPRNSATAQHPIVPQRMQYGPAGTLAIVDPLQLPIAFDGVIRPDLLSVYNHYCCWYTFLATLLTLS